MNLALTAGDYEEVLIAIDSMRKPFNEDYKYGVFVPFEVYAKVQMGIKNEDEFPTALKREFTEIYNSLNVPSKGIVENNARISMDAFKQSFQSLLDQRKTSDTLQLGQAIQLIRSYNLIHVFELTSSTMQEIIEKDNAETYTIETTTVTTSDGADLRVHLIGNKSSKDKLPTVFIFNIYADSINDISKGKFYASKGYNCVVANPRGKGIEAGTIAPFETDGNDAYELIDWISKQKWSNGEVGMVGGSYLGFAQWAAVKKLHPSLKTIMPQVAVGAGIDYPMNGNVFMSYMLRWIHYVTANKTTDYADFANTKKWNDIYLQWYKEGLSFRSLDSIEGRPSSIFQRWLDHPSYDAFWQDMVPYNTEFSQVDIPVLSTTGYFDDDQMGAMYYFKEHLKHNPKAEHYLVIGPYSHGGAQLYPEETVYGYEVDEVATSVNFRNLSLEWFDFVFKNAKKPELLKDKINFQVMGTNKWYHSSSLQEISQDTLTLYYNPSKSNSNYRLSTGSSDLFVEQGVDFSERNTLSPFKFEVIKDSLSRDVLNSIIYESEPFVEPIIISGSFVNSIKLELNKKDLDIVVKVYELRPDGTYFSLFSASGFSDLQRASFAKDKSKRQLLEAGKKETIVMKTSYITAKQIERGSKLVVALGVNKNPEWQINYGTGKDVSSESIEDASEPLKIKWYGDSYIKVPLLRANNSK